MARHSVTTVSDYSTSSFAEVQRGMILVLVQHAGFSGEGAKHHEVLRARAIELRNLPRHRYLCCSAKL